MVKSVFQNWPQRLVSRIVLTYPVLDNLFRSFLIMNRRVSIDGCVMSIELRAELSFLALFMKASSKMKCEETELCFKREFLFSTINMEIYRSLLKFFGFKNLSLTYRYYY